MVNSIGTKTLLELAKSVRARFLMASTSEIYGEPQVHPQPETYWGNVNSIGPRSCYDEAKRFAESLTMAYHRTRNVDVRIARIFNTYGPRSDPADGRLIPNFIVQALTGQPLTIYGDGSQTRSLCFVTDLVAGLQLLMTTPDLSGSVVNLGSNDERSVLQIAEAVLDATGAASPIVYRPVPVDDPTRRLPVTDRARQLLNWEPTTTFNEGLGRTVDYFRGELAGEGGTKTPVGSNAGIGF